MQKIAIIILTRDEEVHIGRAIQSARPLCAKIFVVDSFSSDRTCEIARSLGAVVVQNPFVTQSQQFQWALDNLPIECDWIMRLDADEVITGQLADEIILRLDKLPRAVNGIRLNLSYIFMGRLILYGGRTLKLLRIFRRGFATVDQRLMDEHLRIVDGISVDFEHKLYDHNIKDISFYIDKHNGYASREAVEVLGRKHSLFSRGGQSIISHTKTKMWVKNKIYDKVPFWIGSTIYFIYRYFILLGFMDGIEGLIYHFLQGLWYRFLVGAKIREYELVLKNISDKDELRKELARLSGYSEDRLFNTPRAALPQV